MTGQEESQFHCTVCGKTEGRQEVDGMVIYSDGICSVCLLRQKIGEGLAQHFFYMKYPPSSDALAYNLRWEDIPFDGCESSKKFYASADVVLSYLHSKGVVIKIDRELPTNSYPFGLDADRVIRFNATCKSVRDMEIYAMGREDYIFCQQNMSQAGYEAVVPLKAEGK